MKRLLTFLIIGFAFACLVNAQQTQVTGTVTSYQDGELLVGVSVVVKGTTTGTITDVDGKYSITVNKGDELSFSFIGFLTEVVTVGDQSVIDVTLVPSMEQLDEVVVTALGIVKKERGLTYSTQSVDGEELTTVKDVNMINSLSGKTAGLVIGKSSSGVGGSSRVIIRGNKSINSENQPLYVIDGVPMNNSSFGQIGGAQFGGTVDGGDAISNINPDDIESINVLKGASASALYGSMGQNGVVLITTKKGKSGISKVEISTSTSFDNALTMPEVQGIYGSTVALDPTSTENDPSTWGAKNNGAISTDNLRDFFQSGLTTINSVSATNGNENNQFYLSYANTFAKGIVPTNELNKHNFLLNGNSKINNRLSVNGSANLISQTIENRPYTGFYSNPAGSAYLYGGSGDAFANSKENYQVWDPVRSIYSQVGPYKDYNTTNFILDNPYWIIHKNPNVLKRDRGIYSAGLNFKIMEGLNLMARTSYDRIDDQFEQHIFATTSGILWDDKGGYSLLKNSTSLFYADVLLTFNKDLTSDINIDATIGQSNSYSKGYALEARSVNGQNNFVTANVFSLSNFTGTFHHIEYSTETLMQSVFGTATMGYKNMLFVDVTGRQEWASTIVGKPFFYPSIGGTFILSEVTGTGDILSFAKLRASYSEVGNALPYGVNNNRANLFYTTDNGGSPVAPQVGVPIDENGNEDLLDPERSKSLELGGNIRLFNNSIDLDFTYYNNNVVNQYLMVVAPLGVHVPNYYVNAGEIRNSGVELSLGYKLAQSREFKYSTNLNFAYNNNEIISIDDDNNLEQYVITPYSSTKIAEIRMVKGSQFGDLYASDFQRDANGNVMVDSTGSPLATTDFVKVGNPNSPISLGWSNTFSYKGAYFKFLIDGKIGGEVISFTESSLDQYGRSQRSADARDAGKVEFEGNTVASGQDQVQSWFRGVSAIGSNYVYSATNFRVREIAFGYDFRLTQPDVKIKSINLALFARNLFFLYNEAPFDPEISAGTATGLQGIEGLNIPATRSFGFSVKATF
ncbi:MAG: SusC/RagA family TonB-linked outer membrane protein [Bacteroidales bacterium]|nr:SusC/RagA family TonB-linked outer membrane protein [Bacteroidales bacterium]